MFQPAILRKSEFIIKCYVDLWRGGNFCNLKFCHLLRGIWRPSRDRVLNLYDFYGYNSINIQVGNG